MRFIDDRSARPGVGEPIEHESIDRKTRALRRVLRPAPRSLMSDERGGIHTEGAMVAITLATLFGGFLWIQARMTAELTAVRSAGRDLWSTALEGCDDGLPAPSRSWIGGFRGMQRDLAPEAADRLEDISVSDSVSDDVQYARRPELLGGGLVEVRMRAGTACNTRMPEGAIDWSGRVVELFCERYPIAMNWPGGCTGEIPPGGE